MIAYSGSPEMQRAERLERRFKQELGDAPKHSDWLCEFRKWLDRNGIPAENPDGWMTNAAYDNADHFIKFWKRDHFPELVAANQS
jgi:hypothetical protein